MLFSQGDYAGASVLLEESLRIRWKLGDRWGVAICLEGIAHIAAALGHPDRTARLLASIERIREEIGSPLPPYKQADHKQQLAAVRAALADDAAFDAAWEEGQAMSPEQVIEYALRALRD